MLLTSRPQVEPSFTAWTPERIQATDEENKKDMQLVLRARLEQQQFVEGSDLSAAVELMLGRSEGQFVYLKFAFEALQAAWDRRQQHQSRWSLSQLEQNLPPGSGVECTYLHSLNQLRFALAAERPELLELLTKRVLPVLAMCRKLLTVQELAWAVAAPEDGVRAIASRGPVAFLSGVMGFLLTGSLSLANLQFSLHAVVQVGLLVRLLGNMFPIRHGMITPYHKTVLDWLLLARGGNDHPFMVDVQAGHTLLAIVCIDALAKEGAVGPDAAAMGAAATTGERFALRYAFRHAEEHLVGIAEASSQLGSLRLLESFYDVYQVIKTVCLVLPPPGKISLPQYQSPCNLPVTCMSCMCSHTYN